MNELIGDLQFLSMQQRFLKMDATDAAWVRGKTIHSWCWAILKQIHLMTFLDRDRLHLRMILGYARCALILSGEEQEGDRVEDTVE